MKRLFVMLIAGLLVITLVPFAGAQEAEGIDIPEELIGFYTLNVEAGSFEANEDGETYTLTLEGVPESIPVVAQVPGLLSWHAQTVTIVGDWAASPDGLAATAVIEVDGVNLRLLLSAPDFADDELTTLSFTAEVVELFAFEESKSGPEMPESFEDASLFIQTDHDFEAGLLEGFNARGGRDPRPQPVWPRSI